MSLRRVPHGNGTPRGLHADSSSHSGLGPQRQHKHSFNTAHDRDASRVEREVPTILFAARQKTFQMKHIATQKHKKKADC